MNRLYLVLAMMLILISTSSLGVQAKEEMITLTGCVRGFVVQPTCSGAQLVSQ